MIMLIDKIFKVILAKEFPVARNSLILALKFQNFNTV